MAQVNVNLRVDEDTRNEFAALCENMGLSMSAAVYVFMKKAVSEQRIPFELTVNKSRKGVVTSMDYESIKNMVTEKMNEGKKLPLSGENENGENVVISSGKTEDGINFYSLMTFQKNNWVRVNEYYEDGNTTETFER